VPWLILKEEIGIEVEFINVDENYDIDFEDFTKKYDKNVKVVSLTYVSNVTGTIFNLEKLSKMLREDTLFVVDGSQAVPHIQVDVKKLDIDFMFFTGHKMMAESGI
jgi:cysteine desulfurase/selenocysteine lyase